MQEEITLHSTGSIPGIGGGDRAPGTYLVDWDTRTATPIGEVVAEPMQDEEEQPAPVEEAPVEAPATSEQPE